MIENTTADVALTSEEFQIQDQKSEETLLVEKNRELKKLEEIQKNFIHELESIQLSITQRMQQPISNILGLSLLLNQEKNSNNELNMFIDLIKQEAATLTDYNKELVEKTLHLKQKLDFKSIE